MKLIQIVNSILPVKGFIAMTVWPFMFIRRELERKVSNIVVNHETIHGQQQLELLLVIFYIWYAVEYIVRLCQYRSTSKAYRNISFEREAYANDNDIRYNEHRKHFAFLQYL